MGGGCQQSWEILGWDECEGNGSQSIPSFDKYFGALLSARLCAACWGYSCAHDRGSHCIQKVCVLVVENVKKCRPWKWKLLSCVHGILQARILEWVAFPFSRGSSKPRSPALQVDSLPAEPQGKPVQAIVGYLILTVTSPMSGKGLERVKNNFS